ncbi:MAG: BspA family leucine-rich repeat surface protein [Clostridiales bacterium]|nr:BspA family leucine-rich repeat surface protein [Clostridiales bacterium]
MKVEKRKIALVAVVIMSMVMTAFSSVCVLETGGNKVYAATGGKLEIVYKLKKLVVGMSEYPQVKKGSETLSGGDMTWKSSNKKVAAVNSYGMVTAKKAGTVTITAVNKKNKKQKATCKLVVTNNISGTYKKTKWKLSKGGVLEVKGTGNMYAKEKMPPWYKYKGFVKSAKIEVKGATNLSRLFLDCYYLKIVNLSKLDTSKLMDMFQIFYGCWSLRNLNVSGFNTSKVQRMGLMFENCRILEKLDLSNFDISNCKDHVNMFSGCKSLITIYTPKWSAEQIPELPEGTWTDSSGQNYTTLPVNATESIVLVKTVKS